MSKHYADRIVSSDELDALIETAQEESRDLGWENGPRLVVAEEVDDAEDEAMDGWVIAVLDARAADPDDDLIGWAPIDGGDILAAIDQRGLKLGTVHQTPGRAERVLEIDEEAFVDAQVWALVSLLPGWAQDRYAALVRMDEQ